MARPLRIDPDMVAEARQVSRQTHNLAAYRQAMSILLPADLSASLEQTARVLGVGRATVHRLPTQFRHQRQRRGPVVFRRFSKKAGHGRATGVCRKPRKRKATAMTRKSREQQRTNEKETVSVPEVKAMLSEQKDFLVPVVQEAVPAILEVEMAECLQAGKHERTGERLGYRSGYDRRRLITRVGPLVLRVPQDRSGHLSTQVSEQYQRSEKALVAALAAM